MLSQQLRLIRVFCYSKAGAWSSGVMAARETLNLKIQVQILAGPSIFLSTHPLFFLSPLPTSSLFIPLAALCSWLCAFVSFAAPPYPSLPSLPRSPLSGAGGCQIPTTTAAKNVKVSENVTASITVYSGTPLSLNLSSEDSFFPQEQFLQLTGLIIMGHFIRSHLCLY